MPEDKAAAAAFDKALESIRNELPRWTIQVAGLADGQPLAWMADDPNFEKNGIRIIADNPLELVERVRAFVRVTAIADDRFRFDVAASRLGVIPPKAIPSTHPMGTYKPPAPEKPQQGAGPTDLGPKTGDKAELSRRAIAQGFTGEMCDKCQQFAMVRTGKCTTCNNCGSTSGGCS